MLGLSSEAGEVAGKHKKLIRGDFTVLDVTNETENYDLDTYHAQMKAELGDVMWYVSEICNTIGCTMEELFHDNIQKLAKRDAENKIKGSGDTR